jgi:tetratricopeptide (TPR) repeat protein
LIEPDKISIRLSLAKINTELGRFSLAIQEYLDILEDCTSPQERYEVYRCMEVHFFLRGQLDKGIEYMELMIAEQEKYDDPIEILSNRIDASERYVKAGKTDTALTIVETIEKQLGPPLDYLAPLGYLIIYLELEDTDNIEKYLKVFEKYAEERQLGIFQNLIFFAKAKLHELKGEYDPAIQYYTKVLDLEPANKSMHYYIGRCCRKKKEYKEAEEHLLEIVGVHPCWPEELYELGVVYADRGKKDKALEYMNRAWVVWEDADPGYKPAVKAKEMLVELEASGR